MNIDFSIEEIEGKGKGLICKEFVKEGTHIYILADDPAKIIVQDCDLEKYLEDFPNPAEILNHGYCSVNVYIDLQDSHARFFNHGSNPNSRYDHDLGASIAIRDIEIGEELLESYTDYALPEKYNQLMQKYMHGNWNDHVKNWN